MKKVVKWILGILVGLVLLAVVGVGVLTLMVDPEEIKQQVTRQFEEKTGHSLAIEAPVEWSVFPWVGLRLEKVEVGNAPGFGERPLATVDYLDVKVGLMPLLEKRVAVDTVVLKGVTLNLERDGSGRANWEGLAGGGGEQAPVSKGEAEQTPREAVPGREFQLDLKGIELEDLDLNYVDRQKGQAIHLQDLYVQVGEIQPDTPVMVRVGAKVRNEAPALDLKLDLSSEVTFDAEYRRIDLSALAARLKAAGEGLPADGVELKLAANVALDLAADKAAVTDLSLSGPEGDLTGALSVTGLKTQPKVEGRLTLQQTHLKALLRLFGVALETADPAALSRVSARLELKQSGQGLEIRPLEVQLDDTRIQGFVAVPSFEGPVVRAELEVDAIDLDRYLPPPSEAQAEARPAGDGKGAAPTPAARIDFEPLRKLDADATLKVGRLTVKKVEMEQVVVTLKAKKGVLRLDPVGAVLYQGKLAADAALDVRKDEPGFQAGSRLSGIRIGPLLADLAGEERLTGRGDVRFRVRTRGLESLEMRRNLNGDFAFELKDGHYKGFNLIHAIRKAKAALRGEALPQDEVPQTDFAELRGTGVIRNGVVSNRDLYLASPILRVKGEGQVDLVKETVDYRLTAKIVGSLEGQGGKGMEELKGIPIPVRLTGPLAQPKPTVDAEALVKALAEEKIEEKKQEVMEKASKKIEEKLGTDVLKGLFGR